MPRKFIGERIDPLVDAVRPASLTLTAEDIDRLPVFQDNYEDTGLKGNKEGKRLSRKFGGTLRLKQRLESVPEIFLHDFKRRSQEQRHSVLSTIDEKTRDPSRPMHAAKSNGVAAHPHNKIQSKRVLQRRLPPKQQLRSVSSQPTSQVFGGSNVRVLQGSNKPKITVTAVQDTEENEAKFMTNVGKCDSEILLDEIISYYGEPSQTKGNSSSVLNAELERVLDHVTKMENRRAMENDSEAKQSSNDKLLAPGNSPNSQRYSWSSSGDDFSDVASKFSATSSVYSEREETGEGKNTLYPISSCSVNDLEIKDLIPEKNPRTEHSVELVKLRKIVVKAPIAHMNYPESDIEEVAEEDEFNDSLARATPVSMYKLPTAITDSTETIRVLQQKIDNITLSEGSTLSSMFTTL
ncbi:Dse3p KNAG_0G02750 [Huiozyma naganishii CBS 8797]|uniref:Uncharacterized protein n=1 Tax=Huiozyma naganishii (strain ATCC MYA-139 / BCRC 22969 / CBS 8797 / KCTC 17520 / NBRC 10181 / NCYC 3082 / Yp74L-3) TaxID=1071383 RepID=J7S962_HUIN7|nr:hypothetical protein KNAG_0G02750 [Kazachstania naganishii CBS 8797]CCK71331.1 hypothetical protein KNAG_0G02750 [Kazachstania naganishii CBS 8797]